jgi:hypothetical protein
MNRQVPQEPSVVPHNLHSTVKKTRKKLGTTPILLSGLDGFTDVMQLRNISFPSNSHACMLRIAKMLCGKSAYLFFPNPGYSFSLQSGQMLWLNLASVYSLM